MSSLKLFFIAGAAFLVFWVCGIIYKLLQIQKRNRTKRELASSQISGSVAGKSTEITFISDSDKNLGNNSKALSFFLVLGVAGVGFILIPIGILAKAYVLAIIGFIMIVIAGVLNARVQHKVNQHEQSTIEQFAQAAGLSYNPKPPASIAGNLFKYASLQHLVTNSQGDQFFLNNTQIETSPGPANVSFSIYKTAYDRLKTNFALLPESTWNDEAKRAVLKLDGLYQYQFESNELNQIFVCLLTKGQEVEALTLLSPDTLLWLEANYANYPIILRDGFLYVFNKGGSIMDASFSFEEQYNAAKNVAEQLKSKVV